MVSLERLQTRVHQALLAPVDVAGLVVVRIALGAVMLVEVTRFFRLGFIHRYWIDPPVNFTYFGFDWVQPLPAAGMYALWGALGVLSVMILIGFHYRLAIGLFCLGFTYSFLLEQSRYLNHFYLICLLSFLMCFVPAHRCLSIDAWRRPQLRGDTVPAWALWLIRAQLGIVYFYGGLAKINSDWLLGEPMRIWMAERTDFPFIGGLFTYEWTVFLFSYSGLLLDLLIVPALLWRRTRWPAFAMITLFHVMNAWLFPIGIFPWFMMLATTIFFPSDWPRRVLDRLGLVWHDRVPALPATTAPTAPATGERSQLILALFWAYLAIQVLVPFRHAFYPGDASWTEEGHLFAWRMKLREKRGRIEFVITDRLTGQQFKHNPLGYLPAWQVRVLSFSPDLIIQYAHHLAQRYRDQGRGDVEVRVLCAQSLNGRKPQWLINPKIDLAQQRRGFAAARWIVPLKEPLPPHEQRVQLKWKLAERKQRANAE